MGTELSNATSPTPPVSGKLHSLTRSALASTEGWGGIALVLIVMGGILAITEPNFRSPDNLWNVARANSVLVVVACGMTVVVISRGIDLSVGAMLGLLSVLIGMMVYAGLPAPVTIGIACIGGLLLGAVVNGLLIAKVGISFFVVTLGTLSIFRSLAFVLVDGQTMSLFDKPGFELIAWIGDGNIGPVPVPAIIAFLIFLITWVMLRWTVFGRSVFAIGNNPESARLAGISIPRVQIAVYGLSGLFVGVASVMFTGRIQAATGTAGAGLELQAIAAVLLGGVSFAGGAGSVVGAVLGAVLIGVISNALNLLAVSDFWQGAATGAILIVAVYLDRLRRKRK